MRDRLLSLPSTPTPSSSELDDAVNIIYELMNDSLLVPFIESLSMSYPELHEDEVHQESRQGRSACASPGDHGASSTNEESSWSPKAGFLPLLHIGRGSEQGVRLNSGEGPEREAGLSDDSGSGHAAR